MIKAWSICFEKENQSKSRKFKLGLTVKWLKATKVRCDAHWDHGDGTRIALMPQMFAVMYLMRAETLCDWGKISALSLGSGHDFVTFTRFSGPEVAAVIIYTEWVSHNKVYSSKLVSIQKRFSVMK